MALNLAQFNEAHLSDLAALVGEPLITEEDVESARACLAVAWENVREAGSQHWSLDSAPQLALSIMVSAASRAWMNLGGYTDERADAVTLTRAPGFAEGAELTEREEHKLSRLTGKDRMVGTLRSVGTVALTSYDNRYGQDVPWYERNVMVVGPTVSPTNAHPIPYLPGDEEIARQAGDVTDYVVGHYTGYSTVPFRYNGIGQNRTRRLRAPF